MTTEKRGTKKKFRAWLKDKMPILIVLTLILMIAIVYLLPRIIITIEAGQAGVLYKRFTVGTVTDYVYPERIHFIWPWDSMTIYNVRVQTVKHEFSVLTTNGLPITLKLAIRYQPEYEMVGMLHQRVGPDYVHQIIVPEVESVLRRHIGRHDPEDIYTNKEGVLTEIIVSALEEAGQKFVHLDDIIIRSVELPLSIQKAIEEKLAYQQQEKAYVYRLELEQQEKNRKIIEAEGIKEYQKTISETLNEDLITWQGVQATLELAQSENAKVVVIGAGEKGLPIILDAGK